MDIDANDLVSVLQEQRNNALDELAMVKAQNAGLQREIARLKGEEE